jgi:hypothetical protein
MFLLQLYALFCIYDYRTKNSDPRAASIRELEQDFASLYKILFNQFFAATNLCRLRFEIR